MAATVALVAGGLILPVTSASAATSVYAYPSGGAVAPTSCPVASTLDEACSLEQALEVAVDGDTIVLAADPDGGATFATDTGWVVSQDSLTITADAGVAPVLDGQQAARYLLDYTGAGTLSVDGITVANSIGSPDTNSAGGGVVVRNGTLNVQESTFVNNDVLALGNGGGVVVWNAGAQAQVTSSTFVGNGGSVPSALGGGVVDMAGGAVRVSASTFVDNGLDGGIRTAGDGTLHVIASTFANNSYGISSGSPEAVVVGSVFAGQTVLACGVAPTMDDFDGGYNVSDDGTCSDGGPGSVSFAPHLGGLLNDLADNGGPTQTIAPKPDSPVLGMIPEGTTVTIGGESVELCPTVDQRGVASDAGEACNAGSVQDVVGDPLTITTTWLDSGRAGEAYSAQLTASGGTGAKTWSTDGYPPPGVTLSDSGVLSGTPSAPGSFEFPVEVRDANGITRSVWLTLSIDVRARPWSIAVNGGDGQWAEVGADFDAPLSASVENNYYEPMAGANVTFEVTSGDASFGGSATATAQTDAEGVATAPVLSAGDAAGAVVVEATVSSARYNVSFTTVFGATVLDPLVIETDSLPAGRAGLEYSAQLTASGAAGDVAWSVVDGELPEGLALAEDGTISGAPADGGAFDVTVQVQDANRSVSKSFTIVIAAGPALVEVDGGDGQSAEVGSDFDAPLSVVVRNAEGGAVGAGYDVTFSVTTGDASFADPTADSTATATAEATAEATAMAAATTVTVQTDASGVAAAPVLSAGETPGDVVVEASVAGVSEPATFAATVYGPLQVLTQTLPTGQVGVEYSASLLATGGPDSDYHWSLAAGELPDGLSLADDGTISGTPTADGTFAFTVSVNDPAYADLTIVVDPAAEPSDPGEDTDPSAEPPLALDADPEDLASTGVRGLLPLGLGGVAMILVGGFALVLMSRGRVRK